MAEIFRFPVLNGVAPPNPFQVTTDLPAGGGIDFAKHFCTLFQRELADRFHPTLKAAPIAHPFPPAKEKDHGI